MPQIKPHASITSERILAALLAYQQSLDNPGFCLACGEEAGGCEPDAREYRCESCGEMQVYGAEEVALMLL